MEIIHNSEYNTGVLMRMWDAFLVGTFMHVVAWLYRYHIECSRPGQLVGQLACGILCDIVGQHIALCASTSVILLGSVLFTAARGVSGNTPGFIWLSVIARGIIGVVRDSCPNVVNSP